VPWKADRQFRRVGVALQHDADPRPPLPAALAGIGAQDRDLAAVPLPVPLEDLYRRGLARAVRAQQREHLSVVNVEVNSVHGRRIAV
jgi:hypothetical protein